MLMIIINPVITIIVKFQQSRECCVCVRLAQANFSSFHLFLLRLVGEEHNLLKFGAHGTTSNQSLKKQKT